MQFTTLLFTALALSARVFSGEIAPISNPEIFLDFDGTIAVTEAFLNLNEAAYASPNVNSSIPKWEDWIVLRNNQYNLAVAPFSEKRNVSEELAFQHSEALRDTEKDHFERVSGSGLFNTIDPELLLDHARNVTLRDGFWEMMKAAKAHNATVNVLSRNWSAKWIRNVLRENDPSDLSEDMPIYALEMLPEDILKPGKEGLERPKPLYSGDDKRDVMREVAQKNSSIIFVGDANSDLPPVMLEPTVIGIAAGSELENAYTVGNDSSVELWQAGEGWKGPSDPEKGCYVLDDFREINTLLGWDIDEDEASDETSVTSEESN